jgi:cystathionine beta-lyase
MNDANNQDLAGAAERAAATDPATALIHHAYRPPAGFAATQPPVHKASTVLFPNVAAVRARDWRRQDGYTYGLHGTPSTFTLEARIATLMHARHCLLAPSGLSAVALVDQALLAAGDEVLLPANVYAPSRELARTELARWGIGHGFYDPMDVASLAARMTPRTRLVWVEAPGSVTMEFPDLRGLLATARAAGVTTAVDDTWGSGLAFDAFALGADVVMQALTKYPSGGGDLLMGAVCTRSDALHERLKLTHMHLGLGVGANDVEAVLRGLPSVALRYAAHDSTARTLAAWLAEQPEVARVLHPALPGSPGHAHWAATCNVAAGLFSVQFRPEFTAAQADAFVDALRLFGIGYSWAGPMSLAVPYDIGAMRDGAGLPPCDGADGCVADGGVVRLSIGLEGVEALRADLAQALRVFGLRG